MHSHGFFMFPFEFSVICPIALCNMTLLCGDRALNPYIYLNISVFKAPDGGSTER